MAKIEVKANSLEDLARKLSKTKGVLTTGNVKDILQVSQQTVIRTYDDGWFGKFKIPGSTHRRIIVSDFVDGLRDNWGDFNKQYPQRQLLHLMEVLDLDQRHYGLDGFAGGGGIRFHVQEDVFSTGETSDRKGASQQAVIRGVDNDRLEGYRGPNMKHRRITAGAVVRYFKSENAELDEEVMKVSTPELITYSGISRDKDKNIIEWTENDKVTHDISGKAVWYRSIGDNVHEFSIRNEEQDSGLYVKFSDMGAENPIIYLTLLGKAGAYGEKSVLERDDVLSRVNGFLGIGSSLIENFHKDDKGEILKVLKKVRDRFDTVYSPRSYSAIR